MRSIRESTFLSRADVARMRQKWLSSPDQVGEDILNFHVLFSLCVALRSHVRPLTDKPRSHITHNTNITWTSHRYVFKYSGCCTHETDVAILSRSGGGGYSQFPRIVLIVCCSHVRPLIHTTPLPTQHPFIIYHIPTTPYRYRLKCHPFTQIRPFIYQDVRMADMGLNADDMGM